MSSVHDWYSNFLARRCIPIKRELSHHGANDGFALIIEALHFTKLAATSRYRISCFFFDAKTFQHFGSPYHGPWRKPDHHDCYMNDTLFFHCPRPDDSILLVVEIVCDSQNTNEQLKTIAWAPITIAGYFETVPEYSKLPKELPLTKLKLYPGTPKVLSITRNFNTDTTVGLLDCCLCVHPKLAEAYDFFPDFCIIGERERIPGLAYNPNTAQLTLPKRLPTIPAILEDIGLSFGPHAEKIEKLILDDMKTDRLYRENHNPGTLMLPMNVLERRLRISIHNGYTFLFEPLVVHLSSADDVSMGSHSLRRKGRPLSRSSSDIRTEVNTLFVRSKVSLPLMADDPELAVVFALDYLIGTRMKQGNVAGDAQSVIIGWGAWKPERNKSVGSVHASVPLVGGPRPNPEEYLCFKNLLHLYHKDDSMFTESAPKITIHFVFSTEEGGKQYLDTGRGNASSRLEEPSKSVTPAPRRDIPTSSREERESSRRNAEGKDDDGSIVSLPPLERHKPESARASARSRVFDDRLDQLLDFKDESPRDDLLSPYEFPWKESRTTNIPRSVHAPLAKIPFAQILDRHGEAPPQVDVSDNSSTIDLSVEVHDRLNTNEIVLQFLAFKWLERPDSVAPQKVFFTTQFYRFPMMTTEELLLTDTNNNGEPSVLKRIDSDGREIKEEPGFTAKFIVDRPAGTEEREFIKFLQFSHLFIDVWDAQSLILLGTCIISLRSLLRQGQEAISVVLQCPIVFSAIYLEKKITGLLFLKMANVGHPSSAQIDMVNSRTTAVVSRRLCRLGEEGPESYRILAKPLNTASDNALQRFLQAQRLDIQQRYEELFNEESQETLREWEKLRTQGLSPSAKKNEMKRFIFDEQLESYRKLRHESKASKLLQAVFRGITTQYQIYPGLGEQNFFEFLLENPFTDPVNCVIEMDCQELEIVNDSEIWEFYKRVNALQTPMEKDLIRLVNKQKAEVFLRPHESVYVPFLYTYSAVTPANSPHDTKILFRRWDTGQPLAILDLHIYKRPPVVNRTVRVYHASNSQCINKVNIDKLPEDRRAISVRTSDPTARVDLRHRGAGQELVVSLFCGDPGSSRSILVLLYGDTHCYKLLCVIHFVVHSVERIEVRATLGQNLRFNIGLLRREPGNQLLEICSESAILRPFVGDAPILATAPQVTIPMHFTPQTIGRQQSVVTAVDAGSRQLLHAWLIVTKTAQPTITRRYEMRVPLWAEHVTAKKLPVHNPYSIRRQFRLSSSRPELLQFEKELLDLDGGQTSSVNIFFLNVVQKPVCIEILVFFQNNETNQTEDTFALSITYE